MDLLYFLKERLRFIEQLYDGAVSPFEETKREIEEHVLPVGAVLRRRMSDIIIRLPGKNHARKTEKPNTIRLRDKRQLLKNLIRRTALLIDGSESVGNPKKRFAISGAIAFAKEK